MTRQTLIQTKEAIKEFVGTISSDVVDPQGEVGHINVFRDNVGELCAANKSPDPRNLFHTLTRELKLDKLCLAINPDIDPEPLPDPAPLYVKAPKRVGRCKELKVLGHRDPRGPDNNIYIWVDEKDRLHIRVLKAERCYKFREVKDCGNYVEIVAD